MNKQFDVIVIGMGPGGQVVAGHLLKAGRRVAVVERELMGGGVRLLGVHPVQDAATPGGGQGRGRPRRRVGGARLNSPAARDYRDHMLRSLDDSDQVRSYQDSRATVVKGAGRITGPGAVEVDGRMLRAEHLVVAIGSDAALPPVTGLDEAPVWTNRDVTRLTDVPARAVMIGSSAVGVELGLFLRRYGAEAIVLERSARLIRREDPCLGELTEQHLRAEGVDVRTGATAVRVRRDGAETVVELDGGNQVRCDVLVVGTGRSPRTADLGLEAVGARLGERGELVVDERCQAEEGLWGIGDVTGVMPFTHVAKYQARIAADNILGTARTARYEGIPRVVFTAPEIAAVGLTSAHEEQGRSCARAEVDLAEVIARPWSYEQDPRRHVLAHRDRRVLLGAWAVAPQASEWIHTAALAVREQISIDRLLDQSRSSRPAPEGYLMALQQLDLKRIPEVATRVMIRDDWLRPAEQPPTVVDPGCAEHVPSCAD
jgi:pyruvate/2-oxoglutarate dehydrogenase complex dihydrolipoamide dehydrogenase (E3) component